MFTLETGEEIQLEVRKHWLQLAIESLALGLAAVVPVLGVGMVSAFFDIFATPAATVLALFAYAIWLLLLWAVFFVGWTTYYLDTWIVTNKRLINFDQRALFSRTTSALRLENIQDVEVEIKGILFTLFKLGRIRVQTAGSQPEFVIDYARNPRTAKQQILELVAARRLEVRREEV